MKWSIAALALVAAVATSPAVAHDDWDDDYGYDDGYYEYRHWRGDYRVYRNPDRAPSHEIYIPYGSYYADEPHIYGPNCKVERKWRRGYYKEKIECDDDD